MKLTPFTVILKNGISALVREVTPDDRFLLQIGYAHLSGQSRYFRFLAARHDLTAAELDIFTAPNGPDHVAVGALVEGTPAIEPVGIARYIRLSDQDHTAEIAVAIVDSYQHCGLGSLLLGVLAKFARLNGISEFSALVHCENTPMLSLLGQLGSTQTRLGGAEIEVRIPVVRDSAQHSPSSVGDAFRKVHGRATIA